MKNEKQENPVKDQDTNLRKFMHRVQIIRKDGTPVVYESVKHVLYQEYGIKFINGGYSREHTFVIWPYASIDHVIIEEFA